MQDYTVLDYTDKLLEILTMEVGDAEGADK
jgi:hypothetical protein